MHNWMKAWWTAEPRGSSYNWEGAECYNFKPDSHALFSAKVHRQALSFSSPQPFLRPSRASLKRARGGVTSSFSFSSRSISLLQLTLRSRYSRLFPIRKIKIIDNKKFTRYHSNPFCIFLCSRKVTTFGGRPSRTSFSRRMPPLPFTFAWKTDPRDIVSICRLFEQICMFRRYLTVAFKSKKHLKIYNKINRWSKSKTSLIYKTDWSTCGKTDCELRAKQIFLRSKVTFWNKVSPISTFVICVNATSISVI